MKRILILAVIVAMVLGFSVQVHAQYQLEYLGTDSLGNRLFYETDLDITWYDYESPSNTFYNQEDWAEDTLSVTIGGFVNDNWRLPSLKEPDGSGPLGPGYNFTESEMGHLWYTELENNAYNHENPECTIGDDCGFINAGDFQNIKPYPDSHVYWAKETNATDTDYAWYFHTTYGQQNPDGLKTRTDIWAIAVMDGRAMTPEPISSILFVTGGAVLAGRRYLRRKK